MDQLSLSLKLLKKSQAKAKKRSLFLKIARRRKKNFQKAINERQFFYLEKGGKARAKKPFNSPAAKREKRAFYFWEKGQILAEGLFFIIFVLAFLLSVQLFQSIAREEIQKERLTGKKSRGAKKAPWLKNFKIPEE